MWRHGDRGIIRYAKIGVAPTIVDPRAYEPAELQGREVELLPRRKTILEMKNYSYCGRKIRLRPYSFGSTPVDPVAHCAFIKLWISILVS